MKILIAAIGKAKPSLEHQLYERYLKRLKWKSDLREFDIKLEDAAERKRREGVSLLKACEGYDKRIALDESGSMLSSRDFACQLDIWRQRGSSSFAFIIGGSDGLDGPVLRQADLVWSMGRVTWPHLLVRVLLAEQLYRAFTIINHHPYHRD